jgi:hypothetical protein
MSIAARQERVPIYLFLSFAFFFAALVLRNMWLNAVPAAHSVENQGGALLLAGTGAAQPAGARGAAGV